LEGCDVRDYEKLTAMQEAFCQAYVADPKRNGTRAAISAGYSEQCAGVQASENLRKPNVISRIRELEREAVVEAGYSPESVRTLVMKQLLSLVQVDAADVGQVMYMDDARRQEALSQLADASGGQYILDFGQPVLYVKPTEEWTWEERAAVKGIEATKEGIKVSMHDKMAALKLLSEIGVIIRQNMELSGSVSVTDALAEARARAAAAEREAATA
jgi:hypothetical protein